jgi:diguanylate cyclase (GGDEF)-like protein
MLFALLEQLLDFDAIGLILCSRHATLPNQVYVSTPYTQTPLSALDQQYLADMLLHALPQPATGSLRIEALNGTLANSGLNTYAHQQLLVLRQGEALYGALGVWANTPLSVEWQQWPWLLQSLQDWCKLAIWARKQAQIFDNVTETYQHTYLMQRLQQELQKARRYENPISVMKIVVQDLEHINHVYGFTEGDALLKLVAQKIQQCTRDSDIIGRYRTNEFLVLMPETTVEDAAIATKRLQDTLQQFLSVHPQMPASTWVRIGVACMQGDLASPAELLSILHQEAQATSAQKPCCLRIVPSAS